MRSNIWTSLFVVGMTILVAGCGTSTLSVKVVDTVNVPLSGINVRVAQENKSIADLSTNVDGIVQFKGAPGVYQVTASGNRNYEFYQSDVSIAAGKPAVVDLNSTASLVVRVYEMRKSEGRSGREETRKVPFVGAARLILMPAAAGGRQLEKIKDTCRDANQPNCGLVVFNHVPAGDYSIQVSAGQRLATSGGTIEAGQDNPVEVTLQEDVLNTEIKTEQDENNGGFTNDSIR